MITAAEFAQRQRLLMYRMGGSSAAILMAATPCMRNRDSEYRFCQDSNFYYLTGFAEPDSIAVFIPGRQSGEYVLFCRERNREEELWQGKRAGLEGACEQYGADQAFPIDQFHKVLPTLLNGRQRIYFPFETNAKHLLAVLDELRSDARRGRFLPEELIKLEPMLGEMRLYKSKAEIALMRKSAQIAVAAHERAMRACKTAQYEYQIEAELLWEFRRQGCCAPAYVPVVASGPNACTLHYTYNRAKLHSNDLLLIDAGGEYQHYAADVTRTLPINGHYTPEQAAIYEIVLRAQEAAISKVRPGVVWTELQTTILQVITEGLVALKILNGSVEQLIAKKAYFDFYMHNSGHWLGLDVHDAGSYQQKGKWRMLEPEMMLTVEPGIYIAPDCEQVAERWRGIGVRIEDDVLVTGDGHEILSGDLVKTVADVEALMNE